MTGPRVLAVGDHALTVELGDAIDPGLNARVHALDASLARAPIDGVVETVPTYRSLLVLFEPAATSLARLAPRLLERVAEPGAPPGPPAPGRRHVVPVLYGGEAGPDLEDVALSRGLSPPQVIALHGSCDYTSFMLGFRPGFAYLGLLPEALAVPRRATPRARIAPGSVAIAGRQTAIYPSAAPAGWHVIGRAVARLFDPAADPPATIAPGDSVRFVPVDTLPAGAGGGEISHAPAGGPIEVLEPGLLTTVQSQGRTGYRRFGVPIAGPLDEAAHEAANRVLGNAQDAATLECTIAGPTLRFHATLRLAVTGADLGAVLERADLGEWPVPLGGSVLVRPGNVLSFTGRRAGARAYVAFAGGLDVPVVLRSRATDLLAGFGGLAGRALRAGDRLGTGIPRSVASPAERAWVPPVSDAIIRVVLGPQDDHFADDSLRAFLERPWRLGSTSDRVGYRLEGERLVHRGPSEIVSDGLVPGAIQVPPDGLPIVVAADGPTTGGYPKIATVVREDIPLLAQLVPGEGTVRFRAAP